MIKELENIIVGENVTVSKLKEKEYLISNYDVERALITITISDNLLDIFTLDCSTLNFSFNKEHLPKLIDNTILHLDESCNKYKLPFYDKLFNKLKPLIITQAKDSGEYDDMLENVDLTDFDTIEDFENSLFRTIWDMEIIFSNNSVTFYIASDYDDECKIFPLSILDDILDIEKLYSTLQKVSKTECINTFSFDFAQDSDIDDSEDLANSIFVCYINGHDYFLYQVFKDCDFIK